MERSLDNRTLIEDQAHATAKPSRAKRSVAWLQIVFFLAGAVLLFYLIRHVGVELIFSALSRVGLADSFVELARAGWIHECSSQMAESPRWVEVIASVLKEGAGVVDIPRGEALALQVGFTEDSLS